MPKVWPILAQGFTGLFNRLGIQAVPAGPQWWLSDTVVPMALVDSDVVLEATVLSPLYPTPSSAGELAAPVAGTLFADTGPLPVGNYSFRFWVDSDDAGALSLRFEHRNAANAANIWAQVFTSARSGQTQYHPIRMTLAANERLRIISVTNAGGGTIWQASIFRVLD